MLSYPSCNCQEMSRLIQLQAAQNLKMVNLCDTGLAVMPRAGVYSQYKVLGKDPINVFILAILQTSHFSLMLFFAQGLKGCT